MPCRVELDLVDAGAVTVDGDELGRVLVGEPPPLLRLRRSGELAEPGQALVVPAAAVAGYAFHEREVAAVDVVPGQRRRLVLHLVSRRHADECDTPPRSYAVPWPGGH